MRSYDLGLGTPLTARWIVLPLQRVRIVRGLRSVQNLASFYLKVGACAVGISWNKENLQWQLIFKENKCKRFLNPYSSSTGCYSCFYPCFFQDLIYLGPISGSLDDKSSTSEDSSVNRYIPRYLLSNTGLRWNYKA